MSILPQILFVFLASQVPPFTAVITVMTVTVAATAIAYVAVASPLLAIRFAAFF